MFNHKLSSPAEVDRTIRFIAGRLLFYDKHLPTNPTHNVKIDARGLNLDHGTVTYIIEKVKEMYGRPNLQEVNIIQK